jgi:hypothetical protein
LAEKVLTAYKTEYEKKYSHSVAPFRTRYDALGWSLMRKAKKITPDMDLAQARKLIRDGVEETKNWVGTAGHSQHDPKDHTQAHKNDSLRC